MALFHVEEGIIARNRLREFHLLSETDGRYVKDSARPSYRITDRCVASGFGWSFLADRLQSWI